MTATVPPEVKEIFRTWAKIQREKYGENWKEILAKEMTEKAMPVINKLLDLQKKES